jgi:CO/xanthine dehydrogenase Mo-binding subunit
METEFRLTVIGAERGVACEPDTPLLDAGEVAQGPVAGAIGNAVADAAGVRVRDLPLTREHVARAIQDS